MIRESNDARLWGAAGRGRTSIADIILGVTVFLLVAVPCPSAQGQRHSTRARVAQSPGITADLNADAASDVNAIARYQRAIRQMLYETKFAELEKIANADREGQVRFSGGVWKLYALYQGLKQPAGGLKADEGAWRKQLAALSGWTKQNPDSVTARIALAEFLLNHTEKLRQDVEEEGKKTTGDLWSSIDEHTHVAGLLLKEVADRALQCPHWYFVMLEVQERRDPAKAAALFEEAISKYPTYYPYYRLHAIFLRPEWRGGDGEAERFADEISKRAGGKQGAAIYFEIAAALDGSPSTRKFPVANLSWERIREGYAALTELHGPSLYKLNQFTLLAIRTEQTATAQELFDRIGENWDESTWHSHQYFVFCKTWASAPSDIAALRLKAAANLSTPEGRQYHDRAWKTLGYQFVPTFARCTPPPDEKPRNGYDLFLGLAADGTTQEVRVWPKTQFTECVAPELMKGKAPAPPKAGYWFKLTQPPSPGSDW